jgi:hypothetical protein
MKIRQRVLVSVLATQPSRAAPLSSQNGSLALQTRIKCVTYSAMRMEVIADIIGLMLRGVIDVLDRVTLGGGNAA